MELPEDVIRDEGNCSDNKAGSNKTSRQSSIANQIRIQPLVKPRNIYITPSPYSAVATATSRHYIGGLRQKKSLTFPEDKRLPDKIVSDVLGRRKFENRFILQNNQRSWSGWSSFSQSSSSSMVRRNLRIRANSNKRNSSTEAVSCQFDTIKGGCRIENKTSVVSYPKLVRLGTTTTSTTTTSTTTERSSTSDTDSTTATTKKQTTNKFSFQNLRKHQNKIKEEIKRLVESKMNNNRRIDIDEGFDTLNLGSNQDEELDLPEKEDTTTDEALSQEEESVPDFVVPFSVLQKNKIFKSDNENGEEELSLEVEVDNLRKELSKLKAILEAKPQKKKILKKIKTVVKVKTTTPKPQTVTKTTSSTTTPATTTKKIRKRKNYNEYPRIWDGPQPNCAWDGPGGCGGGFADYYDDHEENFEDPSAGSRLPDISSRRIDFEDDIQEFISLNERYNEEEKFDKSKLLPGKNVKDKIREHLRRKELNREKKGNEKTLVTSSVRPGISQSENRLRDQEILSEDYKIYSVDDWLKMG